MKNLLKLTLLVSAFAVAQISAVQVQSGGTYFMLPDQITLVNDLGYNVNAGGQMIPAGQTVILDKNRIEQLQGNIPIKNAATGQLVGYITYLYLGRDFGGMQLETYDAVVKRLSDINNGRNMIS